jgi:hypothetical protein
MISSNEPSAVKPKAVAALASNRCGQVVTIFYATHQGIT